MNETEFLDTLRRRLAGMPAGEVDDVIDDYRRHFADAAAAGRSAEDVAAALGDPMRLARELRAEAGIRRGEEARTPANFLAVVFGLIALIAVDFVFLLPVLAGLLFFALIGGIIVLALCLVGLGMISNIFDWDATFKAGNSLSVFLGGVSMLGFGVGSGALLLLVGEFVVRALGHFARLHFTLIKRANQTA
jgi:uncharacterized membrane protein